MHRYVHQLIRDLDSAKETIPPVYPFDNPGSSNEDSELSVDLDARPFKRISEWTGVPRERFPPHDRLSLTQIEELVSAIETLWEAFHWQHDLDVDLPLYVQYQLLVLFWDEPVQYLPHSGTDIVYCRDNKKNCWLKEWCMCSIMDDDALPYRRDYAGQENEKDEDEDLNKLLDL